MDAHVERGDSLLLTRYTSNGTFFARCSTFDSLLVIAPTATSVDFFKIVTE